MVVVVVTPRYRDPQPLSPFGNSRSRVLATLQDAGRPMAAGEVAKLVHLHPNTARFHLDQLVIDRAADRIAERRDRPGRPRVLYVARPDTVPAGARSYRLLAQILTSLVATRGQYAAHAVAAASHHWGRSIAARRLTELPEPSRDIGVDAAVRTLTDMLAALGVAAEGRMIAGEWQVLVHDRPADETTTYPEVLRALYAGLLQGLIDGLGLPLTVQRVESTEPDLWIAHLLSGTSPVGDPGAAPGVAGPGGGDR